jgi:translation initiation factor IF-2
MFDPPVARALMAHACGHLKAPGEVEAMAAAWAASKRARASRVAPEQRQRMYAALAARVESLPGAGLRRGARGPRAGWPGWGGAGRGGGAPPAPAGGGAGGQGADPGAGEAAAAAPAGPAAAVSQGR